MILQFWLCLLFIPYIFADMGKAHDLGKSVSLSQLEKAKNSLQNHDSTQIPGFKTSNPPETNIDHTNIGEKTSQTAKSHEMTSYLSQHQTNRKIFKIDLDKDPLIVNANKVILDPQKTMDSQFLQEEAEADLKQDDDIKTCEESGDPIIHTCKITVLPKIILRREKVFSYARYWGWSDGNYNNTDSNPCHVDFYEERTFRAGNWWHYLGANYYILRKRYVINDIDGVEKLGMAVSSDESMIITGRLVDLEKVKIFDKLGDEIIQEEQEISQCQHLEELVDQGVCQYGYKVCLDDKPRNFYGIQIKRSCFEYEQSYICKIQSLENCKALRDLGCHQIKSDCVEKKHSRIINNDGSLSSETKEFCTKWSQSYRCSNSQKLKGCKGYKHPNPKSAFCITGNCADTSYKANQELMDAMSQMAVLREIQGQDLAGGIIFKGNNRACTRHCVNFKDCCGLGKGWGISFGLSNCNLDEKELTQLRNQNRCVQVGTYCAEKVLGVCVRKKTSFCCFGTKLSKIIQEQGRAQLGIGWGEPKTPDCRGFTSNEISRLDFAKMDLSSLYSDIQANLKLKNFQDLNAKIPLENLANNMQILTKPLKTEDDIKAKSTKIGGL